MAFGGHFDPQEETLDCMEEGSDDYMVPQTSGVYLAPTNLCPLPNGVFGLQPHHYYQQLLCLQQQQLLAQAELHNYAALYHYHMSLISGGGIPHFPLLMYQTQHQPGTHTYLEATTIPLDHSGKRGNFRGA